MMMGMVINEPGTKSKLLGVKLYCLVFLVFLGCHTAPRFGPLDLASPGWQTRSGQAIWKPDRSKPEIVGDLLVSSDENGNAYVQFSKAFPIVSARLSREGWQAEFPPQNKRYSAPGNPPSRIVWLQLLRAVTDAEVNGRWTVERTESSLTLTNTHSGESVEAHF